MAGTKGVRPLRFSLPRVRLSIAKPLSQKPVRRAFCLRRTFQGDVEVLLGSSKVSALGMGDGQSETISPTSAAI